MLLDQEGPGGPRLPGSSRSDLPARICPRCGRPFWIWDEYVEHAWHEKP